MKKILLIFFILILLAVVLLAVFIATFDADRYRPLVVSKIEDAVGNPVTLGHLSLAWRSGLALDARDLAVYPGPEAKGEPAIKLQELSAAVDFFSLLQKNIRIGSLYLNSPRVNAVKRQDGTVKILGINPEKRKQAAPETRRLAGREASSSVSKGASAALPVLIDSLEIENGEFRFSDLTRKPPLGLAIHRLDLKLKHVSLFRPISFQGRAGILSARQNVQFSGKIQIPFEERGGYLEDVRLRTALADINIEALAELMPALGGAVVSSGFAGTLEVDLDRLDLAPEKIAQAAANVRLSGGRFPLPGSRVALENIQAEAEAAKDQIQFRNISGSLAGARISAAGTMTALSGAAKSSFHASIDNLDLGSLAPAHSDPNAPRAEGNFSASFQGTAVGKNWPVISQLMAGNGRIVLRDGVIRNLNMLQEVFQKMSILPGLVQTLRQRLPENYQEKFNAPDTVLEGPVDLAFNVEGGTLFFDELHLATDSFDLDGSGRISLQGLAAIQTSLRTDPDLSQAFIRSVNELKFLTDAEGRLQIPVVIQGLLPHVRIFPDLPYIASRLAVRKVEDVLGGILKKKTGQSEPPPTDAPQTEAGQETASGTGTTKPPKLIQAILGGLLGGTDQGAAPDAQSQ